MGEKPVHILSDSVPRAAVNSLPSHYIITLTCLKSKGYNQLVYQLGHELLHVFLSPFVIHPFAEIIACTMSLCCLSDMERSWSTGNDSLRRHAGKFGEYRNKVIDSAQARVNVEDGWAKSFICGCHERNEQLVAAFLLEPMVQNLSNWSAMRLAYHSFIDEYVDDEDWRITVSATRWIEACKESIHCSGSDVRIVSEIIDLFDLK